jgi:deoxycytidylate deaminase
MKTGEGYEFCRNICGQDNHAEKDALLQAGSKASGATMILFGHYYCCEDCTEAIKSSGIRELVVLPNTKVDLI